MDEINLLIISIEKKFGSKIDTYKQVKQFAYLLENEYKIYISLSTLRRFFKTIPSVSSPSKTTLDNLCHYIGFTSYSNFIEHSYSNKFIKVQQILLEIKLKLKIDDSDKKFILNNLEKDLVVLFVESLLNFAIKKNSEKLQNDTLLLIEEFVTKKNIPNLKENFAFLFWKNLLLLDDKLFNSFINKQITNKVFLNYIIFSYIDYDNLNFKYGLVLEKINPKLISEAEELFIKLILGLRDYLNLKGLKPVQKTKNSNKLPPILLGRKLAYELLTLKFNSENRDLVFQNILNFGKQNLHKNLFFIEVTHLLLITKEVIKIEQIISEFYKELFEVSDGFTFLNRSIYLLANTFVEIKNDNYEKANENILMINDNITKRPFFNVWFKLFYHIALYHSDFKNKEQHLKAYLCESNKIGFLIFDKYFCINYFRNL